MLLVQVSGEAGSGKGIASLLLGEADRNAELDNALPFVTELR